MRAIIFKIATQEYLLEVDQIKEIVKEEKIYQLPRTADFIAGTIKRFGRAVPIIDLKRVLLREPTKKTIESCIFIVQSGKHMMGLMVDSASEIIDLEDGLIETPDSLSGESSIIISPYIKGVTYIDDRFLILLDIKKLLTKEAASRPAA